MLYSKDSNTAILLLERLLELYYLLSTTSNCCQYCCQEGCRRREVVERLKRGFSDSMNSVGLKDLASLKPVRNKNMVCPQD